MERRVRDDKVGTGEATGSREEVGNRKQSELLAPAHACSGSGKPRPWVSWGRGF